MNENADEIVEVLRNISHQNRPVADWIFNDAADLIESLRDQLTESQRRERAAVEDMEHIASEIEKCDWTLAKDGELVGSLHLGRCSVCSHRYCDDEIGSGCKFEWRGPQEAGEERRNEDPL